MDMLPFVYGFLIFFNLALTVWKFKRGMILSVVVDIAVFYAILKMHGGSMTGGLAGLIAATLSGAFVTPMLRIRKKA